ncbi:response regulator transcription factor [Streptomyces sp. NPDC020983]|uniref:response regulator transcription factor n=1 Tax=Streptomyces sp. NPDC020983 TaxID=3365106 RepID=UPI0037BA369A
MNAVAARARAMTPRRIELLTLAAQGNTNRQIAKHLNISQDVVVQHFKFVYRALGAYDRAHAVALGIRYGYISTDNIRPKAAA